MKKDQNKFFDLFITKKQFKTFILLHIAMILGNNAL